MLGLVLLYFVGKAFYDLAGKHGKHPWGFAIIGVVSYYGGLLLGGVLIGIILEIVSPGYVDSANEMLLGLMAVPLGVLSCWLTYSLLKKNWSKPREISRQTLDSDLIGTDSVERYDKEER